MTDPELSMRGRIGAYVRWAHTEDRAAATAPARAGLVTKFEREVDPDGTMDPVERARRADALLKAHMLRMSLASKQARAKRRKDKS